MARPNKHDATTREALLDAAETLLAVGGPDAVSVRSVADAVAVSTRAVYSVFGSKPGLMGALAARGFQELADRVNGLPVTDDPLADLANAGPDAFRLFALERPHLFRITYQQIDEEIYAQAETYPALFASFRSLEQRFSRAMDAGLIAPRPIAELVFMYHSFSCGLAVNELSSLPPPVGANFWKVVSGADFAALWRTALAAFVSGLTVAPGKQRPSRKTQRARLQAR